MSKRQICLHTMIAFESFGADSNNTLTHPKVPDCSPLNNPPHSMLVEFGQRHTILLQLTSTRMRTKNYYFEHEKLGENEHDDKLMEIQDVS